MITTIYTNINESSAGLTIDILRERIFFVENLLSSKSNVYSTDYDGQDVTLVVENHPTVIPFQIAYADHFVYWTKSYRLLQRAHVDGASSSAVSSVLVSLQTESGFDSSSSFFSLVAVSTTQRPPVGTYSICCKYRLLLVGCFCYRNLLS